MSFWIEQKIGLTNHDGGLMSVPNLRNKHENYGKIVIYFSI